MMGIYNKGRPRCEVCGAYATQLARDTYKSVNWDNGMIEMSPGGLITAGCDKHPPESRIIDITVSPHLYRSKA